MEHEVAKKAFLKLENTLASAPFFQRKKKNRRKAAVV